MKVSERFALNEWLSDYPHDLEYEQIMDMLIGEEENWSHEDITPWQVVEHFTLRQVADFIENTRAHFENVLAGMKLGIELTNIEET